LKRAIEKDTGCKVNTTKTQKAILTQCDTNQQYDLLSAVRSARAGIREIIRNSSLQYRSPLEVMNTSCLHKTRQKTTEEIVEKIHNVSSI
jgi:hypothetical protein